MYQWRKFEFFEEKYGGKSSIPEDVTAGKIECCSSGRGKVVIGCDDGTVSLLDRGLKLNFSFQSHSSSVLFLQHLKQRNFLVTVGEDEQISPQQSAMCLKVFDLDKMQSEGTSATTPDCIGILRIFTNQFPEANITSFLVLEEAPPILLMAIGLDNGCIYCIKGDIARERITRFKLQVDNVSDKSHSSITGLGFRVDGQALQLFAVTPDSVSLFSMHNQPPRRQTLDQIGCNFNSVTMSDRLELIIGRPEAVYFYEVDGRGPCWAFEGEKKFLGWFRGYLLCVIADQRTGKDTFNVYDLKNRLIAHSLVVKEVSHMLCEWGNIILIMTDKSTLCIGEKDMESKLDMLFKKNLYTVAINLVQSQQADAAATAEVLRKYGDHLYSKQDYDEAMIQYISTIGHLEPSYVIQKFLDAQRIYNLTSYLEKLHEKGLASKDHTTLLLNCYTKLKDVEKLNVFIKSEDGAGEHKFDVETAIRVCRAANYHEHAMYVAKKAGRHELYLKILLEDLGRYEEALQYISSLEPSQAGVTVKEYGKILIEHKPVKTIEILMRLCTEDGESTKRESSSSTYLTMLPSPVDFLNIFIHHPPSLMDFLEKYTDKVKDSPAQVEIHNTLLELYLSNDLNFPSISQASNGVDHTLKARSGSLVIPKAESKLKSSADHKALQQPDFVKMMQDIQKNPNNLNLYLKDQRVMQAIGVLLNVKLGGPNSGDDMEIPEETFTPQSSASERKEDKKMEEEKVAEPEPMEVTGEEKEAKEAKERKAQAAKEKELGNAAYKKKEFEKAIEHYTKATELDDEDISYLTNRAAVYLETGKYDECIKDCDKAVERGRELRSDFKMIARALTRKGTALVKMAACSRDYEPAIETFQKALTEHRNPDTLKKLNEAEKAKKDLEQQEYFDPKLAEEEREKGNESFKQQKYPEAVKHYSESLRRNPKDPKTYSNRAACYTKLGALPEGLKDAEMCIELDPTFSKGYTRKGAVQFFMKEYDKALETYQEGLKHDPRNQELLDGVRRCVEQRNKASRGDLSPEELKERQAKGMQDPEIQNILSDPVMRQVLVDFQENPKSAQEHTKNPMVMSKIQKLVQAGIVQMR